MSSLKNLSDETKGIQEGSRFITLFSAERVFRVGALQAVGIIFSTFVVAFAGSLLVRFNTAVSLPGIVEANTKAINVLQVKQDNLTNEYVSKSQHIYDVEAIKSSVADLKKSVDQLVQLHLNNLSR